MGQLRTANKRHNRAVVRAIRAAKPAETVTPAKAAPAKA